MVSKYSLNGLRRARLNKTYARFGIVFLMAFIGLAGVWAAVKVFGGSETHTVEPEIPREVKRENKTATLPDVGGTIDDPVVPGSGYEIPRHEVIAEIPFIPLPSSKKAPPDIPEHDWNNWEIEIVVVPGKGICYPAVPGGLSPGCQSFAAEEGAVISRYRYGDLDPTRTKMVGFLLTISDEFEITPILGDYLYEILQEEKRICGAKRQRCGLFGIASTTRQATTPAT